jgi:predicted DCC family thiol-disulfide oxidoreductase YuxK
MQPARWPGPHLAKARDIGAPVRVTDWRMTGDASFTAPLMRLPAGPIVLFDAECVLCSGNAQFILTHDRSERFHLASMQGAVGSALARQHGLDPADPSSIVVVDGATVRKDSDAVLSIYEGLGYPWRAASVLRIFPAFARDPLYRWIARNRYRLFGKRPACWVAPERYRSRML